MTTEEIKAINDAISWIGCTEEIDSREILARAVDNRREIHKQLLNINYQIAEHFYIVSNTILNIVRDRLNSRE